LEHSDKDEEDGAQEEQKKKEGNRQDELWEVDKLLDKRYINGNLEYLVKWVTEKANEVDPTWEPNGNLLQADDAIEAFNNNKPNSKKGPKRKRSKKCNNNQSKVARRSMRSRGE
jgi:hypothetical protein